MQIENIEDILKLKKIIIRIRNVCVLINCDCHKPEIKTLNIQIVHVL